MRNKKRGFIRKISVFLMLGIMAFTGYFFRKNAKASGGGLSHDSIVPVNYSDSGDTGKYSFDPRFATVQESAVRYSGGNISLDIYNCTSRGILKFNPGKYVLKSFVRLSDGRMINLPDVDVQKMLNDSSDVKNVWGHDIHKTFDFEPIDIDGAKPGLASISFSKVGKTDIKASLSGSCDWNKTVYSFDYYAVEKGTNKESYVPDEYSKMTADDYLTGFYYTVDRNSYASFDSSWRFLTTDDMSGNTKSLSTILGEEYTCTEEDYYIHVAGRSYTGKIGDVSTRKIPHRQVHKLKYDLNGGEGSIPSQTKIYKKPIHVNSRIPRRAGYTFKKWIGEEGEEYNPSDVYNRDQDDGYYTLKAKWKKNKYNLIFDINERGGENGKCNETNKKMIIDIDTVGILDLKLKNEIKDEFESPRFTFRGWCYKNDTLYPDIFYKDVSKVKAKDLLKKYDLLYTETGTITLYACWDKAPEITKVKNRYFKEDESYKITEKELLKYCKAYDREDKEINFFKNGYIENYDISDFKLEGKRKGVLVYAVVKDSAGNITKKSFWVYIISPDKIKAKDGGTEGYVRFIDLENYKKNDPEVLNKKSKYQSRGRNSMIESTNGGLFDNSIWYLDDAYRKSVDKALK